MKEAKYTFAVDTKKVKTIFLASGIFVFCWVFLAPIMRGLIDTNFKSVNGELSEYRKADVYMFSAILSLGILAILWAYGSWRMFGMEWRVCEDGLQIVRNKREIRFIPWESIGKVKQGYLITDLRDGKKFPITLPRNIRNNLVKIMYEFIRK